MNEVRVVMRWPRWLVAAVDAEAGPRGRARFTREAVQRALAGGLGAAAGVDGQLASAAASPGELARERRIAARVKGGV